MKLKTFEPREYLRSEEDCRLPLAAAYAEDPGDGTLVAVTLGDMVKARAMMRLAHEVGMPTEDPYQSLSGRVKLELEVLRRVSRALGLPMDPDGCAETLSAKAGPQSALSNRNVPKSQK